MNLERRIADPRGPGSRISRRSIFRICTLAFAGWWCAAPAGAAVSWVVHPYLQNLREDRVTIMWSTKENLTGIVQYSTDSSFSSSQQTLAQVRLINPNDPDLPFNFYQYTATIFGLSPGTDYSYRILMNSENVTLEPSHRFRTAGPGPFTFLVFGDSGAGNDAQDLVTKRMVTETPNFVLQVGDIAYELGTFGQFQANYFEYYFTLMRRAGFFTVPGNHEYYTNNAAPYLALNSPPTDTVPLSDAGRYYSFDWGDVHFVGLDSNLLDPGLAAAGGRMLQWLENDLSQTRAPWRIAYWHHLPYPISQHETDPISIAARNRIVPILERHGVQLVFTGHEHTYQRTKPMHGNSVISQGPGTVYITTGGGGGGSHAVFPRDFLAVETTVHHYVRVEADAAQLTIHAVGTDGKDFDKVTLALPVLPSANAVVNAASFTSALAPGELVSIFGQTLASGTAQPSRLPLPTDLAGTTVTVNGIPIPLVYASPGQINAQLPVNLQGAATLRVTSSTGFSETDISIAPTAPAIFAGGILHANSAPVTTASPARGGETLIIYVTGLGGVDGPIATGDPAPASPLLRVTNPVVVELGDISVTPDFAGLTPNYIGLYQINVVVPPDLPAKTYPLRIAGKGAVSNSMNVPVSPRVP